MPLFEVEDAPAEPVDAPAFRLGKTRILVGDCREGMRTLPPQSVHCVVTSPPYYGLRDYGTGQWEGGEPGCQHQTRQDGTRAKMVASSTLQGSKATTGHQQEGYGRQCARCGAVRVDQQIGLEASVEVYIETMVNVFREVWRVLRDDGTCLVNCGDSYAGSGKGPTGVNGVVKHTERQGFHSPEKRMSHIPAKNLMLIPWRFVIAMQDDGWIVRSIIAWEKLAPMPEPVVDRPTSAWEPIFLLTKRPKYFWDGEAVRVPSVRPGDTQTFGGNKGRNYTPAPDDPNFRNGTEQWGRTVQTGLNGRNLWNYHSEMDDTLLLGPEPLADTHYAAFPTAIPRMAVLAGTSAAGVCSACGAPWKRCTTDTPEYAALKAARRGTEDYESRGLEAGNRYGSATPGVSRQSVTTGWQPSCRCNVGEPAPATVLDPFGGSGTSGMVANRLQRDAILCELNPAYAQMARDRIVGDLGMLADVEIVG